MPKKIVMYTTKWCGDCWLARHFLKKHNIAYQEVLLEENHDAMELVIQVNHGKRSVPTFEIDGSYINCSPFSSENRKKLAQALGISEPL